MRQAKAKLLKRTIRELHEAGMADALVNPLYKTTKRRVKGLPSDAVPAMVRETAVSLAHSVARAVIRDRMHALPRIPHDRRL